ncbi:MAG TPA: PP2C family protein-serine/threonine phosphatase [Thermoanaerobaculia bacterium]|nr:PP2C family protein-serine/threonine phosphatase [Thermoanaerobaculia bacterium]
MSRASSILNPQSSIPSRRTYGWRTWGDVAREIVIAIAIGCAVTAIESGGMGHPQPPRTYVRNAILSLGVMMVARLLETMLSWAIEQSRIAIVFRTMIYAVGGWIGYFSALAVVGAIFGYGDDDFDTRSYHFAYTIGIAAVASIVMGLILHHNRKRNDRLVTTMARLKEHEFAEKELEIARAVQQRLLPPAEIERDGYRITARTHGAHIVAGDFYDVVRLADGCVAIAAADVSGKGIAASLIMATCKAMLPFLATSGRASDVMRALNESLCEQLQRREFVAMLFARFDPTTGVADVVNAGMPDPFLLRADGTLETLAFTGDRFPLGARRSSAYEATAIRLGDGDRLLAFSDGLPEALVDEAPVGYERVEDLARRARDVDGFVDSLRQTPGIRFDDDLTVLMLERTTS